MFQKRLIPFVCVAGLLFSGCNYMSANLETLVRPPNLSQRQEEIYNALKTSVQPGGSINLISPESGSYRSGVIFNDIDTEPTEEAIAFYKISSQSSLSDGGIRVCLLDQVDGVWRAVWDIPGQGSDVDKILFLTDIASGCKHIIIGFSPKEEGRQKVYCIYDYQSGVLQQRATGEYQMLETFDIDANGQEEIITISYKEEGEVVEDLSNMAYITRVENGQFTETSSVATSGKAISYPYVTKDQTSFGTPALIIDEQLSKSTYATEILIAPGGVLQNLTYQPGGSIYEKTMRTQAPFSYDVNKDGVIEIPKTEYFPGYSESSDLPLFLSKWSKLNDGKLEFTNLAYVNYSQGYGLLLPDSWEGRVTATNLLQNDEVKFFVYHGDIEDDSEPILSIKMDTINDFSANGLEEGYFELATVGQMVYSAKIYPVSDPTLALTPEQVKGQFIEIYTAE